MKKIFAILTAALLSAGMWAGTKTLYLSPNANWKTANAWFAVYAFGDGEEWYAMTATGDVYQAAIDDKYPSVIFCRMNPDKSLGDKWDGKWNQTGDLTVPTDGKDLFTIPDGDWDGSTTTWSQYEASEPGCEESYGLLINGVYHAGTKNELQTGWKEYMLRNVELNQGDSLQVYSVCADAAWVFDRFAETSHTFAIQNNKYVVDKTGTYDFYFKFIYEADEVYIALHGFYGSAVPSQCEDVLMQAFFNESYDNSAAGVSELGNTQWSTLLAQSEEISSYFDLVWLPPSAAGDGMGYHPKNYGNQNSNWGSAAELASLLNALHDGGTKVVADIVINHCQSTNGWLGFPEFDFGEYGKFQPSGAWVCKNDEVNTNPEAGADYGKATGSYDDGENWEGARDWAHDMPEVQNMFKAYLQWMREVVGYDGFRYDKGDGFNNWHHDNYNKAAGPYIAFMECYSNTDEIWSRIQQANYNLMALDFDTKWHVFDAFAGWDYNGKNDSPRGDGLLGRNNGRYAVTFIDSHDWFLRSDNENEFGGRGNSLTETMKARLLQANAFLLSMPGVPCVFYPHWKKHKEFIKPMIEARKLAGVHSESEVRDEYATSTGYQATIVGKYGYLILCLGDKAHQDFSQYGYDCKASYYAENDQNSGHDASFQMWVNRVTPLPMAIGDTQSEPVQKAEKLIRDGRLLIRIGNNVFDITGKQIQ
ncbi:MAG: hypothetical protein IJ814_03190 [Paludibacteraceae bacterium]|nr:hypothetical protein [Paludibacteraceae bacterium]